MIIDLKPGQSLEQMYVYNKIIVDIYATWCGPCKMLATQLEAFAAKHKDWTIVRVDSEQHSKVAGQFGVQAIPTMVVIANRQIKEIVVGYKPLSEIERITNKY